MTIALLLLDMFQPIHDRRWLPRKWTLVIVLLLFVFLILLTAKNAMLLGMLLLVIALILLCKNNRKMETGSIGISHIVFAAVAVHCFQSYRKRALYHSLEV